MKVDDFIEDLEALCVQYWGPEVLTYRFVKPDHTSVESLEDGVVILFDDDTKTK